MALAVPFLVVGCSPDVEEEAEDITPPEPIAPALAPDEISVKVGRFQAPAELENALAEGRFYRSVILSNILTDPESKEYRKASRASSGVRKPKFRDSNCGSLSSTNSEFKREYRCSIAVLF